jgi:hypothetical protein
MLGQKPAGLKRHPPKPSGELGHEGRPMPKKHDVFTVKDGDGWKNVVDGNEVSHHRKQSAAIDRGREIAIENHSEHSIQGRDGKFREKNSYGNDDFPPRG